MVGFPQGGKAKAVQVGQAVSVSQMRAQAVRCEKWRRQVGAIKRTLRNSFLSSHAAIMQSCIAFGFCDAVVSPTALHLSGRAAIFPP